MGRLAIKFPLDEVGGELFGKLTEANLGNYLAIVVDGKVVAASAIRSKITMNGQITGNFTPEEVSRIVASICAGMGRECQSKPAADGRDMPTSKPTTSAADGASADRSRRAASAPAAQQTLDFRVVHRDTKQPLADMPLTIKINEEKDRQDKTDAEGRCRIALPAGQFGILADPQIDKDDKAALAKVTREQSLTLPTLSRLLELKDGQKHTGLRIVMDAGGMIAGTVHAAATGQPIADAYTDVQDRGVNTILFGRHYSRVPFADRYLHGNTDKEGRFTYRWVPLRQYKVSVSANRYLPLTHDRVDVKGGRETTLDLKLQPDPMPVYDGPAGSLAGRVFLPDGKTPAAGVKVAPYTKEARFPGMTTFWGSTQRQSFEYALRSHPMIVTREDGSFVIDNLPEGTYGVAAEPNPRTTNSMDQPKHIPVDPKLAITRAVMSERVAVKGGQQTGGLRIVLQPAGAVSATVRDARTGAPIGRAKVYVVRQEAGNLPNFYGMSHWFADDEGRVVIPCLAPGRCDLSFQAMDYKGQDKNRITIRAEQTLEFDIRLQPK